MNDESQKGMAEPLDPSWTEQLARLSVVSERAHYERLRSYSLESALREFEELCRQCGGLEHEPTGRSSHPVGLVKYMRRSST